MAFGGAAKPFGSSSGVGMFGASNTAATQAIKPPTGGPAPEGASVFGGAKPPAPTTGGASLFTSPKSKSFGTSGAGTGSGTGFGIGGSSGMTMGSGMPAPAAQANQPPKPSSSGLF